MINYLLLKAGIKDLYFYYYIWRFIIKNRNSEEWKRFKLRYDWVGRIYTVQSIKNEDILLPEEVRSSLIIEEIKPLVTWLEKNNMGEILMPDIRKIPDSYSYLVKFSPLFYEIGIGWLFSRALLVTAIYYVYPYIKNLIEYVSK